MRKLSMKWRIILPIGIILTLGIGAIIWVIARDYANTASKMAIENLQTGAAGTGNSVKAEIEQSFASVKTFTSVLESAAGTGRANRGYFNQMMKLVLAGNSSMATIWAGFEPDAFDNNDSANRNVGSTNDASGRYIPVFIKEDDKTITDFYLEGYDDPKIGEFYQLPKTSGREAITSPYFYKLGGKDSLVTSTAVPVFQNGDAGSPVLGVFGADISLENLYSRLKDFKVLQSGYVMLMDHAGNLVFHPSRDNLAKEVYPIINETLGSAIRSTLADGLPRATSAISVASGTTSLYAVYGFPIADTGQNWCIVYVARESEVMAAVNTGVAIILIAGVCLLIVSLAALYVLVSRTIKALNIINAGTAEVAGSVVGEAASISEASAELAENATAQAASIEEISAAIEQMASMTRQNADNAEKTQNTTNENDRAINKGAEAISAMTSAMSEIDDSAGKIGNVIKTIEDIAFQTNLLALNAAVEAARAGEAGKGFAVVADEVRNLAQRSAQSAKETTTLIGTTVDRVKNGTVIAGNLASCFTEIEQGSSTVTQLIKEIASATNEQALGVDQINTSVATLDRATQQIAANSEQLAATGNELNGQSDSLGAMMTDMSLLITGEGRGAVARMAQGHGGTARLSRKAVKIVKKPARKMMALENKFGK